MTTVIVNGTFDILHPGHVAMLNTARSLGNYLIVCIDTDRRVQELKGVNRPINNQLDRKVLLQNLKSVDIVEFFDSEEELIKLIKLYKPSVMVKGSDYKGKRIVGEDLIPKVFFYDRIDNYSTTKTIQHIADRR
jgi:D-beta-D-heptose 7-phosphate kinase/D-beta-D-heptose 1-phosphate adenosyltransferase